MVTQRQDTFLDSLSWIKTTKSLPATQVDIFSNDLDMFNCFANDYKSFLVAS